MAQKDEPSMEEILSSIKRIIAEDGDAPPVPPRRARAPELDADPDPDVLELDEAVFEPVAPASAPELPPEPMPPAAEEAPALAAAPSAPRHQAPEPEPRLAPELNAADTLVSRTSAEASRQALAALSKMVVKPEDPVGNNTLEGLVRELLRPMLRDWLDANLPRIVQATVDREVARISGRQ